MQEEKHIYSSSLIKRIEDKLEALKKETKTYFQFERKTKIIKTEIPEKPKQPSPPPVSTLKIIAKSNSESQTKSTKLKVQPKTASGEGTYYKSPGIKSLIIKKPSVAKETEEKILVTVLLASIIFFIILGIILSH